MLLTACATFRGMPSLEVMLPERFSSAKEVKSDEVAKPASTENWWMSSEDATLQTLLREIEEQNLTLEQARFRLLAARSENRTSAYLPNLTVNLDTQYNKLIKGQTSFNNFGIFSQGSAKKLTGFYNAKLDASWELPLYGQYGQAEAIEQASLAFSEADVEAVRASVMSEAVRLYVQMRQYQQEARLRAAIIDAQQKIVDYQNIKHGAGLITDNELGSSQINLLSAQNDAANTASDLAARQQQLATLLGLTAPPVSWNETATIPEFATPALQDTPLEVLRQRPDIRQSEANVLSAAAELELAKTDLYPKVTLSGTLSQLDNLTGNTIPGKTVQLSGLPSLSLPLFDWGKRLADAHAQDAKLSENAAKYKETVIRAMNEVEEFWVAYRTAQSNEENAHKSAMILQGAAANTDLLFSRGISDGIEAENAKLEAMRAEITALQAQSDRLTQLVALTKALGGMGAASSAELPTNTDDTPTTQEAPAAPLAQGPSEGLL